MGHERALSGHPSLFFSFLPVGVELNPLRRAVVPWFRHLVAQASQLLAGRKVPRLLSFCCWEVPGGLASPELIPAVTAVWLSAVKAAFREASRLQM